MVEESLRAIFEAEKKAKEKVEAANIEAASILEETRKNVEKINKTAQQAAKTKSQKVMDERNKKAEEEVQTHLKELQISLRKMEQKAARKFPEAVDLVFNRILGE